MQYIKDNYAVIYFDRKNRKAEYYININGLGNIDVQRNLDVLHIAVIVNKHADAANS